MIFFLHPTESLFEKKSIKSGSLLFNGHEMAQFGAVDHLDLGPVLTEGEMISRYDEYHQRWRNDISQFWIDGKITDCVNLSRIDNIRLKLELEPHSKEMTIRVVLLNYNCVRYGGGTSSLRFSSY
jgi:hypothetical protein